LTAGVVLAALAAVVIWGASPVATKLAVADLAPLTVAVLRTVAGGLAAIPVALALRIPLPATPTQRRVLLLSGFCGFVFFPVLFSLGVHRTSANHASMILASLPLFTGAIAHLWERKMPARWWWLGCAVALAGEAVLIGVHTAHPGDATLEGDLIVLGANLFASMGYVAGARLQREGYPSTGTTFWGAALPALLLLPLLPFLLADVELAAVGPDAWAGVAYLAIGVTIVGYVLWYGALGRGGIARMGLFQFFQPISGVALAALLLGEAVTPTFLLASMIVLGGVWIALRAR